MDASEFSKKKKYSEASGSMAVVDSNIKMKMNKIGLYEENLVNKNNGVSNVAVLVSPNLNNETNETIISTELYAGNKNISFDDRIGYFTSLYAGHVLEDDYRENASSGGMGTWIFKELYENDLVDYVISVKKDPNSESNTLFKYEISSSIEEIKEAAKTRYYPVEISEVMKKVKNTPGRYAIIGIPSFIYSVRLLAKNDKIIDERIKFTIGLICGHQKSKNFSDSMAFQVGIQPGNLKDIDFRHKLENQPASSYAVKMTGTVDGELKTIIKPKSELFGQDWGWGFFKPTASNFTDDVFNETADIVLGDAWLPEYTSDSKGNNIIIVRNIILDSLIKKAIETQKIKMDIINENTVFASQAAHYRHTHDELAYRLHVKELAKEWRPYKRVTANDILSENRKKIQDLRKTISEHSHIEFQKAVEQNNFNYFVEKMTEYTTEYTLLYRKLNRRKRIKRVLRMRPNELINELIKKIKNLKVKS